MKYKIIPFTLGPLENNTFLVIDLETKFAAIVDPSFGSKQILGYEDEFEIKQIWCTHAHFDHIAGINELLPNLVNQPEIFLHKNDLPLWLENGGAKMFGFPFEIQAKPTHLLEDFEPFKLGNLDIETIFTPGHTPGHVIFSVRDEKIVFSGDLIFRMSVGRTDLPGGSHLLLLRSIDQFIKPLTDDTRLLSGHGPETTVGFERKNNPFL